MAEPFKNRIDTGAIERIAALVPGSWDRTGFVRAASADLADLELKDRVNQVADALRAALPDDFPTALEQILAGLPEAPVDTDSLTDAFELWPLCSFVERHGLDHPAASLAAMPRLTPHWSCEFAIRPFYRDDPDHVHQWLDRWVTHDNVHVRRLVSEGTRPRLPWGIRLDNRIADPERMRPLLEQLRDDPSEYVRRSVANHLNDIAKDHPAALVELARDWLTDVPARHEKTREKLVRHALRTQIKAGDPAAFALIGLHPFEGTVQLEVSPRQVVVGEPLDLSVTLTSTAEQPQRVRLDYGVHYLRKNGSHSAKVFKLAERTIPPGHSVLVERTHRTRIVTTRRLYAGQQRIDVRVNGVATPTVDWTLHLE